MFEQLKLCFFSLFFLDFHVYLDWISNELSSQTKINDYDIFGLHAKYLFKFNHSKDIKDNLKHNKLIMAEDLNTYQMQLQQVTLALAADPENAELLKLQTDLQEVIELTQELIKAQEEETKKSYIAPGTSGAGGSSSDQRNYKVPTKFWKVGDKCQAKWSDGQYHDATIESITDEGEVNLMFDTYQNRFVSTLKELRERKVRNEVFTTNANKRQRPNQKEYLKKKKQKKQLRLKEIEQERESEKSKWLNFTAKTAKKGQGLSKSIFASPESVEGRVGIGTCGISGKGMTDFVVGEKYRKGM